MRHTLRRHGTIAMNARRPTEPGPSLPTPQRRAQLEEVARQFGVKTPLREDDVPPSETVSGAQAGATPAENALADVTPVENGRAGVTPVENALTAGIGVMMGGCLWTALALAVAALSRNNDAEVPAVLASFIEVAEPLLKPMLVAFFALSGALAVYKQSESRSDAEK